MPKAPIRVAIVDDEPAVRTALARFLDASSFETKTYGSAREFIDSIRNDEPECLVVDVHMPDFTGLDLQRYLRFLFARRIDESADFGNTLESGFVTRSHYFLGTIHLVIANVS